MRAGWREPVSRRNDLKRSRWLERLQLFVNREGFSPLQSELMTRKRRCREDQVETLIGVGDVRYARSIIVSGPATNCSCIKRLRGSSKTHIP